MRPRCQSNPGVEKLGRLMFPGIWSWGEMRRPWYFLNTFIHSFIIYLFMYLIIHVFMFINSFVYLLLFVPLSIYSCCVLLK